MNSSGHRLLQWMLIWAVLASFAEVAVAQTLTLRDGIWAERPQECDPNHMEPTSRMELKSGVVKFYEVRCDLRGAVKRIGSDRVSASASCRSPDETFSITLTFRVIDATTVEQISANAPPTTFHLCGGPSAFAAKVSPAAPTPVTGPSKAVADQKPDPEGCRCPIGSRPGTPRERKALWPAPPACRMPGGDFWNTDAAPVIWIRMDGSKLTVNKGEGLWLDHGRLTVARVDGAHPADRHPSVTTDPYGCHASIAQARESAAFTGWVSLHCAMARDRLNAEKSSDCPAPNPSR